MELPEIAEVQRWRVEPGDRIVVLVDYELDVSTGEELGRQVKRILGVECPVLVLPRGVRLKVVNEEETDA